MPTLMEDLAQSARENRAEIIESARQAAERAISRVPEAEAFWNEALAELRETPTGDQAESLLRQLLNAFESSKRLVQSARALCQLALQVGASPEQLRELDIAERRFEELASEAKRALEHRASPWQPADSSRLAQGFHLAREGKTIKSDEARSRFPRTQS